MVLMSTIQKRSNNTYTITVSLGYGADGKQIRRTKTIEVDSSLLQSKPRNTFNRKRRYLKLEQGKNCKKESAEKLCVLFLT